MKLNTGFKENYNPLKIIMIFRLNVIFELYHGKEVKTFINPIIQVFYSHISEIQSNPHIEGYANKTEFEN